MIDHREQAIRDVATYTHKPVSDITSRLAMPKSDVYEYHLLYYAVAQRERVLELEAELALQKGVVRAQYNREREAAKRLGMVHNCDWPDEVAERVLELEARLQQKEGERG